MKQQLIKLIDSEIWANDVLAKTIENASTSDERVLLLFSHITSAYSMWLSRLTGTEITTTLFAERTLSEARALQQNVFAGIKDYLQQADDTELSRVVHFTFPLDGSQRKISVADAILHLVTHSAYHRGQMIARLKDKVDKLPLTTYIAYATEVAG